MYRYVGGILVTSTLDVSDPCYSRTVKHRLSNVEVKQGSYNCFYRLVKTSLGLKICCSSISYDDMERLPSPIRFDETDEVLGKIFVDSGTAGFFSTPFVEYSDEEWDKLCDDIRERSYYYAYPGTFFTCSGYGDGCYEVKCKRDSEGRIIALCIVFINEDEII